LVFSQILDRIDNKLIRQMKLKKKAKSIVQHAFLFGTGIGKLGFGAQFTPTPDLLDTEAPLTRRGYQVEYHADVHSNQPWFMPVHPGNFIVPKGITTLEETPWVCEWIQRPFDDLRNDSRFKNVKDDRGAVSSAIPIDLRRPGQQGKNFSTPMVDIWEIRDKRTKQVIVLAPYLTDKVILTDEDVMQHDRGVPYYDVVFNEDDERFWGVPDSVILEPQQLEKNEIRTFMMYHRRLSLMKLLYEQGAIGPDELSKLLSGDPMAGVMVTNINGVKSMELAGIPDGLLAMDQIVDAEIREDFGFSRNQFGDYAQGSADRTKFETQVIAQASEIRVDERRDMMADMLISLTNDLHHVIFSQWTGTHVVDIVGPMGVPYWIEFTPDMLKHGSYDIKIDPDTAIPETKGVREQRAMQMYTIMKENPFIDPIQLTQYLIREMGGPAYESMIRLPQGQGNGTAAAPMSIDQYMQTAQRMAALQGGGEQNASV